GEGKGRMNTAARHHPVPGLLS
ncbi:hypothetical protein I7I51_07311, partial [Histoplasma capsulatum]